MRRLTFLIIILLMSVKCLALQKNVASQKWYVFAFDDTDNSAKTGDAGQITANLRIDGAAADAVDDTNPTELEDGYYVFDLTQGETNGDYILICPASSTGDIQVIGCPMATWTTPPYFPTLSIDSNGRLDIIKVAGTTQTANDMSGDIDDILVDTGTTLDDLIDTEIGTIVTAVGNIETDTAAYDTDAEYATAIWNALTNAYGGAGTYGQAVEDILVDTSITLDDFIDTEISTIVTAVGNIETDTAAQDSTSELRTLLTGADTPVCKDSTPLTAAETESEVDDALGGGTGTALTAIPWNSNWDAEVESEVDDSVGGGTGTALTAIPWNSNWDAEVESEVEDAVGADVTSVLGDTGTDGVVLKAAGLNADAVTEIWAAAMSDLAAGAPSATASVLTAINYLYEAWRNQTWSTATEIQIYKNDASTKLVESTISDDGTTFKRGEIRNPD